MNDRPKKPVLYIVVCAAGIAGDAHKLITAAQKQGWDVGVVATPQGLGFLDTEAITRQTGYPIRSAWRGPSDPRLLPPADAIAVAPATFNTINKWAAGMAMVMRIVGFAGPGFTAGLPRPVEGSRGDGALADVGTGGRRRPVGVTVITGARGRELRRLMKSS